MLYTGESTTPFDPRGRTRGKPSQLLLDNYKYLEYINIFDSASSAVRYRKGLRRQLTVTRQKLSDFACF